MNKIANMILVLAVAATAGACNRGGASNGANGAANNASAAPSAAGNNAAAAPAGAAPAAAGEGEVRAFLDSIYAPYATEGGTGADYSKVLDPQLAAALEKREGGIDADPFIDAQDWTPFRPTYENVQVKGDRAIATAAFSNGGTATRIDYQLIRTPTGWRVFDVQSANGGSLRERIMNAQE